jgi:hypothetical protein
LISTEQGRIGLARSRHDLHGSESAKTKQKTQVRSWVHDSIVQAHGKFLCKHCDQQVSATNITRRKEHWLKCGKLLSCETAQNVAKSSSDEALKKAVEQHKPQVPTCSALQQVLQHWSHVIMMLNWKLTGSLCPLGLDILTTCLLICTGGG